MARQSKAQLGCLSLLLAWAVLGIVIQLTGSWSSSGPGDDEGGGPFAIVGILGLVLFVVIFTIAGIVRAIASFVRKTPRPSDEEPTP